MTVSSVDTEGLAEGTRLLDQFDHVDLLLEEDGEEVGFICAAGEKLLEGVFVLLTGHEGRSEASHEALSELTVTSINDALKLRVVLLKVGCDQIGLQMTLPEALDLKAKLHQRIAGVLVEDLSPEALLKSGIRKAVV